MGYKALYREYRPETFEEVVGQQYIVKALQNAIKNIKVGHAYLFCGPRGTGKTTIAKLLAKALNCKDEFNKPCGKCETCKAISNGSYSDVIEIDAASNNNVDEVRSLIEKIRYAPLEGKYKVYIIDEVHMMTSSAFNALLKTLEEPPEHVIFILATTEVNKVLPTIISRCQRFDFTKVSNADIKSKINEILYKENITAEPGVSDLIASLADGGVRDALSILDQTIAYSGNNITLKDVRTVFGILSNDEIIDFLDNLNDCKVLDCLNKLDDFDKRGIDLNRLTNTIIECLKDVIVYSKTGNIEISKRLNSNEISLLSDVLDVDKCFKYIDILVEASLNFKKVSSVKQYYELVILKLCDIKSDGSIKETKKIETEVKQEPKVEIHEEPKAVIHEDPKQEFKFEEESIVKQEETYVEPSIETTDVKEEPQVIIEEETIKVDTTPIYEEKIEEQIEEKPSIQQEVEPINEADTINDVKVDEEMLLPYLCLCKKELIPMVTNIWPCISRYLSIPKYRDAAVALRDTSVLTVGENVILISCDFEHQADYINSHNMYFKCKELISTIFDNKEYYLIATTKLIYDKTVGIYIQRRKVNQLPTNSVIKDLYTKEDVNKLHQEELSKDANVEKGKALFGDLFKAE